MIKDYKTIFSIFVLIVSVLIVYGINVCKSINNQFIERNIAITKNIANEIVLLEEKIEQNLKTSIMLTENSFIHGEIRNKNDLINLKNKIGITHLDTVDRDGKIEYTTKHYSPEEWQRYYNDFRLFKYFPGYAKIKDMPDEILFLPFSWNVTRKLPTKHAMMWSSKTKRLISPHDYTIHDIMEKIIKTDKQMGMVSITLSTPSGQILSSARDRNVITTIDKVDSYSNGISVKKDNGYTKITMPFGGLKREIHEMKQKGLTNESGEYFYVLTTFFSGGIKDQAIRNIKFMMVMIIGLLFGTFKLLHKCKSKNFING